MKQKDPRNDELNAALADWRDADSTAARGESLSERARIRILRAVRDRGRPAPAAHPALFLPFGRIALAAGLPSLALLLVLALVAGVGPAGVGPAAGPDGTRMQVSKQGDEVIFVIANGGRTHNVYRSTRPDGTSPEEPFATAGAAFRDRLDSGDNLVYYRID